MRRFFLIPLIVMSIILIPCISGQEVFAAEGPNVTNHTQAEIIQHLDSSGVSFGDPVTYSTTPVKNTVRGSLSTQSRNDALAMLNNIRFIAGLAPVTLDDDYGELAQAAAFVDASIGKLTHYPKDYTTKPDAMSDEDWDLGAQGAGSANIARGYATLNSAVLGWTFDEDSGNISRIGHRRWCLNPGMGKTGFGAAFYFYAMYSLDRSGSGTQTNVIWPAANMPVEYFAGDIPWSISTGTSVTAANVTVTLTRQNDGKVWTFSGSESYDPDNARYFNVNNDGYGQTGCIIFRPDGIDSYKVGDRFHVKITGAKSSDIEYDVNFFNAVKLKGIQYEDESGTLLVGETENPSIGPIPYESEEAIDTSQISYESSDGSVASVASDGTITGQKIGTAVITATYHGMTAQYTVHVKKSLYDAVRNSITVSNPVYTGNPVYPTSYTLKDGDKVLEEGVDFTVSPEEQTVNCDDTYHYLIFYGRGNYVGNIYRSYYILPREITADMITVDDSSCIYNGSAQRPGLTLSYNDMTLTEGTDYTVTPVTQGSDAGTYRLRITGKGNYQSSCTVEYTIHPKPLSEAHIAPNAEPLVYNGAPQMPPVAVTDGNRTLIEGTDYSVAPDSDPNACGHTLTITGANNYTGELQLPYTIAKAGQPPLVPAAEYNVPYTVTQLSDDILSDLPGWGFDASVLGTGLTVGEAFSCNANYTAEDAANYETVSMNVTVTRSACKHEGTEIRGASDATCTSPGYTGDEYCTNCKELLHKGQDIQMRPHVPAKAVMENVVPATCTEAGSYDEVTYCRDCTGELKRIQKPIKPLGHDWNDWIETTPATCTEEGEHYRTCRRDASHTETESIPATGHTWNAGVTTKAPTTAEKGEIRFTCDVCGATRTESIPKLTPKPAAPAQGKQAEQSRRAKQMGAGGTALGAGASAEAAEAAITGMKTDADPPGSAFGLLQLKSKKQTAKAITISWKKVPGARTYVIYGNQCGTANKMKRLAATGKSSLKISKVVSNSNKNVNVKKGKYYKFLVVALDSKNNVVSSSKVIHVATKGGKVGNDKKVTTKAKKKTVTIKVKKKFKLKAKAVPASKKLKVRRHRAIAYETTDPRIAVISKKGVITGKKKGACFVYAYAQNGVMAKIKVVVK